MAKRIHTEIEISAPPEKVWKVLTDFDEFPQWNPFIRQVKGSLNQGDKLEVRLQPSGERAMSFKPTVLKADPARELRWIGRVLIPGIFDGEHSFTIDPIGENRVRFTQEEKFTGIFVPFFSGDSARRGFEEMNVALKQRAENLRD